MSSKERKYRVISGVAYPPLVPGKHKSRKVTARLDDKYDTSFYHDESIRLSEAEMREFVGKPICVEHNKKLDVGEVTHVFADEKGMMRMTGRIYVNPDDPMDIGQDVFNRVEGGSLTGMSVGYGFKTIEAPDGSVEIDYKTPDEITLCLEPFFGGACVSVTASNSQPQQSKKTLFFQIMASESSTIPAPVKPNEEASTLALETDRMAKRMQELEAANKALADKVKLAEDAEEQRLAEYAQNKRAEFDEIMKINEQQFKEENGPEAVLPAAYREASEGVALNPSPNTVAAWQGITASARAWKRERDAKVAQQQQMEEMSRKLKALEDDRASAMHTVQLSATKVADSVTASAGKQQQQPISMSNLFIRAPAPSEAEREVARMNYGHLNSSSSVHGVLASAKPVEIRAAATHPHLDKVRNSLRNRNAALFAHLSNGDFSGVHVNLKSETFRDGEKVGQ